MNINSVNLSEVTTYRFGGICKNFISIESEDELSDLENIIKGKENVILGKGSNVAFSDKEFYGNVLTPKFEELTLSDNFEIKVGSSVFLPKLSRFFKDNSLSNAEFLIGIPGTVGGAIKMNAGAYGWEFSELLKDLKCFDLETFEIEILKKEELEFSYRKSKNLDNLYYKSKRILISNGKSYKGEAAWRTNQPTDPNQNQPLKIIDTKEFWDAIEEFYLLEKTS